MLQVISTISMNYNRFPKKWLETVFSFSYVVRNCPSLRDQKIELGCSASLGHRANLSGIYFYLYNASIQRASSVQINTRRHGRHNQSELEYCMTYCCRLYSGYCLLMVQSRQQFIACLIFFALVQPDKQVLYIYNLFIQQLGQAKHTSCSF